MKNYKIIIAGIEVIISLSTTKLINFFKDRFIIFPAKQSDLEKERIKINFLFKDNNDYYCRLSTNIRENTFDFIFNKDFLKKFSEEKIIFLLRTLFQIALIQKKIILFHGSSFYYREDGYIVFGKSGSGKTTSVSKLSKDKILSDDCGVIRILENNKIVVCQTPFEKDRVLNKNTGCFPVNNIFYIRKTIKKSYVKIPNVKSQLKILGDFPYIYQFKRTRKNNSYSTGNRALLGNKLFIDNFKKVFLHFSLEIIKNAKLTIFYYNKNENLEKLISKDGEEKQSY